MRSPFTKASGVKFMKRLMMLIKKSKEFFLIISRVVRLLWNSSKSNFIKTIIVSVISGITIPFTLVIWKYLIDDMSRSIVSGSIAPVLFWLILYFILNYLQSVLMRIKDYQQNILSSYLNRYTSDLILRKVKDTDLKYFDSSTIYDKIRKVNEESTGRSISLLATLTSFIQSFSSLIGTITVLASLNIGIMFLCIFICIPTLIVSTRQVVISWAMKAVELC